MLVKVEGRGGFEEEVEDGSGSLTDEAAAAPSKKEEESKERQGNNEQRRWPSVHNNQTEYVGGRREMEMVAATLVAMVTTPKSMRPRRKMGKEGWGTHDNRGVKEEVRRWRMLMMTMIVVVSHDVGDKWQSTKKCESGIDIDCGCGGGKQRLAA
jgi:hypothetical protein